MVILSRSSPRAMRHSTYQAFTRETPIDRNGSSCFCCNAEHFFETPIRLQWKQLSCAMAWVLYCSRFFTTFPFTFTQGLLNWLLDFPSRMIVQLAHSFSTTLYVDAPNMEKIGCNATAISLESWLFSVQVA